MVNTKYRLITADCDERGINSDSSVIENFNTLEDARAQMHLTDLNENQVCVLMDDQGVVYDINKRKRKDNSV